MPPNRRRVLYINDFQKGEYFIIKDNNNHDRYYPINKISSQTLDNCLNPENPNFDPNTLNGKYFLFDNTTLYVVQYIPTPLGQNPQLFVPQFARLLIRTPGDKAIGPRWEINNRDIIITYWNLNPRMKFYSCNLFDLPEYNDDNPGVLLENIIDLEFVYNSNAEAMIATHAKTITQNGEELILPSTTDNNNKVHSILADFMKTAGKRRKSKFRKTKRSKITKRVKKSRKYIYSKKF